MSQTVLVKDKSGTWKEPAITAYENERELQQLVGDSPDLLTGQALATVAEFWIPEIGSADIVGIGRDGSITIVECKLRANPQIRREVVGQLLAYAGGLWQMSFEDFAATWEQRAGHSLIAHLRDKLGEEIDEGEIRAQIASNLRRGSFTLMIAVDEITSELKRIIEYTNTATRDEVRVLGLELQLAKDGETQILIPRTYGESLVDAKVAATKIANKWNARTFGAELNAIDEAQRNVIAALMKHGETFGNNPWWGVGQTPGMSWYYRVGDQLLSMFQIYLRSSGAVVAASIGGLNSATTDGPLMAKQMLDGLRAIPSVAPHVAHVTDQTLNRYPSIPVIGGLDQPGAVEALLSVIDDIRADAAARVDAT